MSNHYNLTVPVEGSDGKTRYTRVGVMFQNTHKSDGETVYSLKLDFPVAVTELVAFPPKADSEEA